MRRQPTHNNASRAMWNGKNGMKWGKSHELFIFSIKKEPSKENPRILWFLSSLTFLHTPTTSTLLKPNKREYNVSRHLLFYYHGQQQRVFVRRTDLLRGEDMYVHMWVSEWIVNELSNCPIDDAADFWLLIAGQQQPHESKRTQQQHRKLLLSRMKILILVIFNSSPILCLSWAEILSTRGELRFVRTWQFIIVNGMICHLVCWTKTIFVCVRGKKSWLDEDILRITTQKLRDINKFIFLLNWIFT